MKKLILSCITIVFALLITSSLTAQKENPFTEKTSEVSKINVKSGVTSYDNMGNVMTALSKKMGNWVINAAKK